MPELSIPVVVKQISSMWRMVRGATGEIERANIIAAGRSSPLAVPSDLLDGGLTVAVNMAIRLRDTLPVDAWAVQDNPRALWPILVDHLGMDLRKMPVWSSGTYEADYAYLGVENVRTFPRHMALATGAHGKQVMGTAPTVVWSLFSCVRMGARRVRIIDADMDGVLSPLMPDMIGSTVWSQDAGRLIGCSGMPSDVGDRWVRERAILAAAVDGLADEGVTVEMYNVMKQESAPCSI